MLRLFWYFAATALVPMAGCAVPAVAAPSASCQLEAGFSPEGSASALVLRTLESARQSIKLAAYSFTSPDIARALIEAHRRGVDVQVLVDEKSNRSKASRAALNLLVNAGIATRTISAYQIHHDKYIIIDGATVETGSMNYTRSAQRRNSENALVVSACPDLARQYLDHWQSRWDQGQEWRSEY